MATTKWVLDPAHAEVTFKVKHMMISNVSGKFTKFDATAETEGDDFGTGKVTFTADVDSINTGNDQRDGHLKAPDFFDAASFPKLKFVSTKINPSDSEVVGELTIRDITKPVKLEAEFGGVIKDPWGNNRTGVTISGKINRKDFGISFHALTDNGGLMLSDDVRIHVELEFIKG
jgi:polyisoprenoid-binding protein YceI